MLLIPLALLGCTEDDDTTPESAANMEADVAATARVLEEIALQPTTVEDCFEEVGCTFCFSATGTPLSGTFDAGLEDVCEVTYDSQVGTAAYTITDSSYTGTWSTSLDTLTVSLSGSRTTQAEGVRDRDRQPAVLVIDEASVEADTSGVVERFALAGSYTGSGGRLYTLDLVEEDGQLEGTVAAEQVTCAVEGTRAAPVFDCQR